MTRPVRIGIVGGGLMGTLCADTLTNPSEYGPYSLPGPEVIVFDPGDPRRTAANSSAAFVDPTWTAPPRVRAWQRNSLCFYTRHCRVDCAGIAATAVHVYRRKPKQLEDYEYELGTAALVPEFPLGTGFDSFRINPPLFLDWLRRSLIDRGVQFVQREISSFEEAAGEADTNIIINTSGVGAQALAKDPTVIPYRGHCAVVRCANVPRVVRLAALEQTWCVPTGGNECRIGGTRDENCWDLEPDETAVNEMFRRVQKIMPEGFDPWANLVTISCGLRPGRKDGVRLEHEPLADGIHVVHCYGHGGEGFTLGPGCAIDVRTIIERIVGTRR